MKNNQRVAWLEDGGHVMRKDWSHLIDLVRVGELAKQLGGISPSGIRYWLQIGLLQAASTTKGRHVLLNVYTELPKCRILRVANRQLSCSLEEARPLLDDTFLLQIVREHWQMDD